MTSTPKMTLAEWLDAHGVSVDTFADRVGTSRVTVYRWCSGENFPRRDALARISEQTSGQVTADSFARVSARASGDAA